MLAKLQLPTITASRTMAFRSYQILLLELISIICTCKKSSRRESFEFPCRIFNLPLRQTNQRADPHKSSSKAPRHPQRRIQKLRHQLTSRLKSQRKRQPRARKEAKKVLLPRNRKQQARLINRHTNQLTAQLHLRKVLPKSGQGGCTSDEKRAKPSSESAQPSVKRECLIWRWVE